MRTTFAALLTLAAGLAMAAQQFGGGYGDPIQWSTLARGTSCAIRSQGTYILHTQNDFETYWRTMNGLDPNAVINIPKVADWMTEDIVAIHMGQVRTAGFSLGVDSIQRVQSWNLQINLVITKPSETSMHAQVIQSPYILIRIHRTSGNYTFFSRIVTGGQFGGGGSCCCNGGCHCSGCNGGTSSGERGNGSNPIYIVGDGGGLFPYDPKTGGIAKGGTKDKDGGR